MAILSEVKAVRVRLSDGEKKTLCTFSGINPNADADGIELFAAGINELRRIPASYICLVTESELTETD